MISLDLRQLEYFITLADAGTISGAASRIGIAQPSLSEALAKLEHQLDVQLVLRGARGTQLTEAGAVLAKYGREILKNIAATLEKVRHEGGDARGLVAVGLPPGLASVLTVPLAETVQVELPLVKLRISEGGAGHLLEWLASGTIDFAILYYGFDNTDFDVKPLLEEELFLVSAVDNWPPAGKRNGLGQSIEFKDLKEISLVLPSPLQCPLIAQLGRSNSIQLNVKVEMDSLQQIASMVSRASAYTIMSHTAAIDYIAPLQLLLVPIINPGIRLTAHIVRKRNRPVTQASLSVQRLIPVILKEMITRHGLNARLVD
ncbi:LysR family transcriptional regulator [Bradyrhizobium sp. AZCC 2289]|uniref:LysR family transcriptional regulator n=1 Tax=Bradyrhizobium sp. AZCC 2289 TaxID=3117026 RepID=UPI002FF3E372